jgi:hypothetical protein
MVIILLEASRVLCPLNIQFEPTEVRVVHLIFRSFCFFLIIILNERKFFLALINKYPEVYSTATELAECLLKLGAGDPFGNITNEQTHLIRVYGSVDYEILI